MFDEDKIQILFKNLHYSAIIKIHNVIRTLHFLDQFNYL